MRPKKIIWILFCYFLILNLTGCEAFVRKFTRKSKKKDQAPELVLSPEEYIGPDMPAEELYRQYFIYWKSWQDELINSLSQQETNIKKKVSCAKEAIKNLQNMKSMLVENMHKNIDIYIAKTEDILSAINADIYGKTDGRNMLKAEKIKKEVEQNFAYQKIKNYLK